MTASNASEEEISTLAHEIWESEGRPVGRDREHWFAARDRLAGAEPGAPRSGDVEGVEDGATSSVGKDPAHVRPAGRKTMDMPPATWSKTDEEVDESFPASDPPGNY